MRVSPIASHAAGEAILSADRMRGNFHRVFGLWLTLSLACWAQGPQKNPVWFNQPQFFALDYGSDFPYQSPLNSVPYTGEIFGTSILETSIPDSELEPIVASWHSQGGLYFFVEDLYAPYDNGSPPANWDSFRMRNLDGAYIDYGGFYGATPVYSLSGPVFRQALLTAALHAVDLGGDGITFDDSTGQLSVILGSPDASGSFDSVTMAAFQAYLQQSFTPSQLLSQFGISDIGNFNYASYIRANSLTTTWNRQPLTGLARQFYLFKRQEELNFLRKLISTTKQYAQQKYGRNFLFAFNDGDDADGYFLNDVMDFEFQEAAYIRGQDHPFRGVDTKAWKGWKSPNVVLPSPMGAGFGPGAAPYLSGPTVNLERVLIADIQAAGGMNVSPIELNLSDGTPEPVDLSVVSLYANFIRNNPQLMTQTTTNAQTLLLQSAPSLLETLGASAEAAPGLGRTDYIGTGRLLLDSGINYDSLFLPDTSYSQLSVLAPGALMPYKVVIAPYSWALDDNQVSVLLAYAQQGGTLIIDGHFANSQPDGTPASRPNVQAIMAVPGAQPYGSGTILITNAQYGIQYRSNKGSVQVPVRAAFTSLLAPYVTPDVVVTQPPAQIHEPGVGAFFYRDVNGHALVHLVNYDYNDSADQFVTKANIQVQVQVGLQQVNAVALRSPDIVGAQSLPFTQNGSTVTVTVPQVYAWDILYFELSTLAPVINSTTPAATLGAVGGNSLTFGVQASEVDGNPLTYTWSVNGQLVANVFTPSYTLQLPVTAGGLYIITVSVTDGARVTENSWTINVKGSHLPMVLFDETNGEVYSIDLATAGTLNPGHTGSVSYAVLAQAIQPLYTTSRLTAGSITPQSLSGVSTLVLAAPTRQLSTEEQLTISTFVQNGGGLIFMTLAGLDNTSINSLLGPWGISIDNTLILSPAGSAFFAFNDASNPALPPYADFQTNHAGSLNISPPAVSLVQTDKTAWKSLSGQPTQQPGDPSGPFTLIGSAQYGSGRVFVVSDSSAFDDGSLCCSGSTPPNIPIFVSGLAWVSAPSNPAPAPPGPPNVSVSSISLSAGKTSFAYTLGGSAPATQAVNISNAGGGTLAWSAASNSPWLTVSPASGMGAGTLTLGINTSGLSAQTYNGGIAITAAGAANSPQTIFVALSVSAPPVFVAGVPNSASYAAGPIAPGELVTIAGSMLGPSRGVPGGVDPSTGKMVTQLAGTSVTFNGVAAPLLYVSATQVNAVVPYEVAGCTQATLKVQFQGTSSPGTSLPCASVAPGLFTLSGSGIGQAAAANQNGALNGPSSPAAAGSYVTVYFTGGGQTNPPGVTGSIVGTSVLKWLTQTATVTVGGVAATVAFDGAAPAFIDGLLQLNIQLSPNTPSGNAQPVVVTVGNVSSPATATLAVQ